MKEETGPKKEAQGEMEGQGRLVFSGCRPVPMRAPGAQDAITGTSESRGEGEGVRRTTWDGSAVGDGGRWLAV